MNTDKIIKLKSGFDLLTQTVEDSDIEFWYAREIMEKLGYGRWENFSNVIQKAITAFEVMEIEVENHFRGITKMVELGSGAQREIEDIMLTRYACYLIAQNGDPRKEQIAFAQTYFAIQTRKQEVLEERIKLQERLQARNKLRESETVFSDNIYERGVDDSGFARIRSKGDAALFGGHTTRVMKPHLSVPENRPLADFLPTMTIAAKNLATEITNHNVNQNDIQGEKAITGEHVQNNASLRNMLGERGIKPEELPAEEDLKKIERRAKSAEKKMIKQSELPKRKK